jgi:uncharacterized spore protein YtfJ
MEVTEILQTIGERLQTAATVKSVFGEPITAGDRTVIPVARVRFGFGGGGGHLAGGGGGGGGGMRADPAGVVEITAAGTTFKAFPDPRRLIGAIAIGIGIGMILARRKR